MKPIAWAALLILAAGCATSPDDAPAPQAAPRADAEKIAELQTSMTELLERLDVMSARLARLEEERSAPAAVPSPSRQRPSRVEPHTAPAADVPEGSSSQAAVQEQSAVAGAEIAERYRQGIILMSGKKYDAARPVFERVLSDDPTGSLADNALFWLGESHFATGDYSAAIRYYSRVTSEYSDQNKAPDALFKLGLAHEKTGDLALARTTLQQVIERYPYSTPAAAAKKELDRIRY
jgi:tol-pal system protein YbgF